MNLLNWSLWTEIQIFTFFFLFVRVTSLVFFLPLLGDRTIPVIVKILFGLALAFVTFPIAWNQGVRVNVEITQSVLGTLWAVGSEVCFGMMVGFVARWIFDAVQFAGYFAGTSIGFSIATVFDPHAETETISLAELKYVLAALLFLALDGHHVYITNIVKSFELAPLTKVSFLNQGDTIVSYLILLTSQVILLGVKLCIPVIAVIFLVNITFSLIARVVPQVNILAVSFTANIVAGLFIVFVSLPSFHSLLEGTFDVYAPELLRFMKLFGN